MPLQLRPLVREGRNLRLKARKDRMCNNTLSNFLSKAALYFRYPEGLLNYIKPCSFIQLLSESLICHLFYFNPIRGIMQQIFGGFMSNFIGKVFDTRFNGKCEILKYNRCDDVVVRFLDTGFVRSCDISKLKKGNVKDYMRPSVFGVGFIGSGCFDSSLNSDAYSVWHSMMGRCYNENCKFYKTYGKSGVEVCEEWHNFQNFAEWFYEHIPSDRLPREYDVDKDIKIKGNKLYHPEKCMIVKKEINIEARFAKNWSFKSPSGDVIEIYNLNKFCKENNLQASKMSMVSCGKRKSHKGWKRAI